MTTLPTRIDRLEAARRPAGVTVAFRDDAGDAPGYTLADGVHYPDLAALRMAEAGRTLLVVEYGPAAGGADLETHDTQA